MSKNNIITTVLIAIIIGGLAFFGGMKYQASKAQAQGGPLGANQRQMFRGTAGRGANGGFLNGQIISKDSNSITVKDRSGNSRIVLYSASTAIGKVATGTPDDLAIGSQVTVIGQTDSNTNTITAQSINLTPAGFPGFGNRPQGQNGGTPPDGTAPAPANQ